MNTILFTLFAILFIFIGYIICYFHIGKGKNENTKRKGLLSRTYTIGDPSSNRSLDVEFEVMEIESTDTKTKVKVVGSFASNSEYNTGTSKDKLIKMIDGSWVPTNDISWIEKSTSQKRDDKINELLNN